MRHHADDTDTLNAALAASGLKGPFDQHRKNTEFLRKICSGDTVSKKYKSNSVPQNDSLLNTMLAVSLVDSLTDHSISQSSSTSDKFSGDGGSFGGGGSSGSWDSSSSSDFSSSLSYDSGSSYDSGGGFDSGSSGSD